MHRRRVHQAIQRLFLLRSQASRSFARKSQQRMVSTTTTTTTTPMFLKSSAWTFGEVFPVSQHTSAIVETDGSESVVHIGDIEGDYAFLLKTLFFALPRAGSSFGLKTLDGRDAMPLIAEWMRRTPHCAAKEAEDAIRSIGRVRLTGDPEDGSFLVFGGDAVDHACGDLHVLDFLVSAKRRFPQRVFALLGNRDINKLRLSSELALPSAAFCAHLPELCHWMPPSSRNFRALLQYACERFPTADLMNWWRRSRLRVRPDVSESDFPSISESDFGTSDDIDNTRDMIERLQAILTAAMNSPNAFELRRKEIALSRGVSLDEVDDVTVCDSFIEQLGMSRTDRQDGSEHWWHGLLLSLLDAGDIVCVIGDSLFAHGGVTVNSDDGDWGNLLRPLTPYTWRHGHERPREVVADSFDTTQAHLPSPPPPAEMTRDALRDWLQHVSQLKTASLSQYRQQPLFTDAVDRIDVDSVTAQDGITAVDDGVAIDENAIAPVTARRGGGDLLGMIYTHGDPRSASPIQGPYVHLRHRACRDKKTVVGHVECGTEPSSLAAALARVGVNTVLVGHKPVGDTVMLHDVDGSDASSCVILSDTCKGAGNGRKRDVVTFAVRTEGMWHTHRLALTEGAAVQRRNRDTHRSSDGSIGRMSIDSATVTDDDLIIESMVSKQGDTVTLTDGTTLQVGRAVAETVLYDALRAMPADLSVPDYVRDLLQDRERFVAHCSTVHLLGVTSTSGGDTSSALVQCWFDLGHRWPSYCVLRLPLLSDVDRYPA
ncbi:MAG: hypothetical protein MHM6MM_006610 [Cercozoa sp. M6MM]